MQYLDRNFRPGARLPPIRDLARRLDLGQNNTQRAIRQLVEEGWLESAPRRGTFRAAPEAPGPQPAPAATTRAKDHQLLGVPVQMFVASQEPDSFLVHAMDAAAQVLREYGCQLLPTAHASGPALAPEARAVMLFNPNEVAPAVFTPGRAVAVVDTGMDLLIPAATDYDLVGFDSHHAGYLAGQCLRATQAQGLCFLGCHQPYDQTSAQRLAGLEMGWGAPIPTTQRLHVDGYLSLLGARAANAYLNLHPRPEAVCAVSDELAVGLLHGLASHDLEAGRDYQLIAFDGQEFGHNLPTGKMTTVAAPMAAMGRRAAELLMSRCLEPHRPPSRVLLTGALEIGGTTRH